MIGELRRAASVYPPLCRVRVSLLAALSAAVGSILCTGHIGMGSLETAGSVFLLACGMSAMNQLQERHIDARMPRTRNRPIPRGALTPRKAAFIAAFLLVGGLCLLALCANQRALLLGIVAVLWYNGLYTSLKKRTAFAVIPGALVGSLGPAIGWVAAGGSLRSAPILTLCLFFYVWQIPHFWLLMLEFGQEYERAGLPSMSRLLGPVQMRRIASAWIIATVVASLIVVMALRPGHPLLGFSLPLLSIWIISEMPALIRRKAPERPRLFKRLNAYMAAVLLLIILGKI